MPLGKSGKPPVEKTTLGHVIRGGDQVRVHACDKKDFERRCSLDCLGTEDGGK